MTWSLKNVDVVEVPAFDPFVAEVNPKMDTIV